MADWPQFRGPNGAGVSLDAAPIEFGPGKNELWRVPLDAGHSSPCIVGDAIFLTTFQKDQKKLAVVCLNRANGEIRWHREVPTDQIERGHPSFNPASSTPAADGERVVAYFGSFGLICFDVNGEHLWEQRIPLAKSFAGNAASPIIAGDRVILYRGNYTDHFLLALDKTTGRELWKVPQAERFTGEMACTAVPIVSDNQLIVHTARSVQTFDLSSGSQIWVTKCATTATTTPVLAGNEIIVAAWNKMGEPDLRPPFPDFNELIDQHDRNGNNTIERDEFPTLWIFHRPEGIEAPMNGGKIGFKWVDQNQDMTLDADEWANRVRELESFRAQYKTHGMLSIPLDSQGIVTHDRIRTLATRDIPEVPSPVYDGSYLYFVKNGGILTCIDLESGKQVYRMRTTGRGTHYASPIIADGKLYTVAGKGRFTVLTTGPNPKILATNEMRDRVYATPAIVDGILYVRTHSALFAFGENH